MHHFAHLVIGCVIQYLKIGALRCQFYLLYHVPVLFHFQANGSSTLAYTVQLNLNFTHTHTCKTSKLAHAHIVACNFDVRMQDSKHMRHTRDAHHELALGLPHYKCGVTTGTVAVGNEIQLLCS